MTEPHFKIGRYERAAKRSCGSSLAHSNCKFAGKGWQCDAPAAAYSDCPHKAGIDIAVFVEPEP